MKNRRGEIATILTIGTLVIIGVATIASSLSLNQKRTTSSRASMTCMDDFIKCGPSGGTDCCDPRTEKCSSSQCVPLGASDCGGPETCSGNSNKYYKKAEVYYTGQTCSSTTKIDSLRSYCAAATATCEGPTNCATSVGNKYWKKAGAYYPAAGCASGTATGLTTVCPPPTSIPQPSVTITIAATPGPQVCAGGGQKITGGAGTWSTQTCEQICGANNGTYVRKQAGGPEQQGQDGDKRWCCCSVGNTNSVCPQPGLGYACCVIDDRCPNGEQRYRWYGCTGQVCSATKINTSGGYKNLVDCPYGVDKSTNQETGVCSGSLTPPALPSADCTDHGTYGLSGGCMEKCNDPTKECVAAPADASGEKRFCCPKPSPDVDECTPKTNSTYTYACISSDSDADGCINSIGAMSGSSYVDSTSCVGDEMVCCKKRITATDESCTSHTTATMKYACQDTCGGDTPSASAYQCASKKCCWGTIPGGVGDVCPDNIDTVKPSDDCTDGGVPATCLPNSPVYRCEGRNTRWCCPPPPVVATDESCTSHTAATMKYACQDTCSGDTPSASAAYQCASKKCCYGSITAGATDVSCTSHTTASVKFACQDTCSGDTPSASSAYQCASKKCCWGSTASNCTSTSISCNSTSGICGAAGGSTTKEYYHPSATVYAKKDEACSTTTETDLKTWCECKAGGAGEFVYTEGQDCTKCMVSCYGIWPNDLGACRYTTTATTGMGRCCSVLPNPPNPDQTQAPKLRITNGCATSKVVLLDWKFGLIANWVNFGGETLNPGESKEISVGSYPSITCADYGSLHYQVNGWTHRDGFNHINCNNGGISVINLTSDYYCGI